VKNLFEGQRFITRGVQSEISLVLQLILWDMVSSVPCEKDYLQVFKLCSAIKDGKKAQVIQQSQEVPPYKCNFEYYCEMPVTTKLFCIDDDDGEGKSHCTLLLAAEY
jgi:hypothetical protein